MRYHADEPDLDAYYGDIAKAHLQPLWEMRGILTPTPVVKVAPRIIQIRIDAKRSLLALDGLGRPSRPKERNPQIGLSLAVERV